MSWRIARPAAAGQNRRRSLVHLALAAGLVLAATPAWATDTDCDGSEQDTGGYTCTQHASNVIPDISTAAISSWSPKSCSGDDCFKLVNLSSGSFTWYGTTYSSVYVGSNGYVSFGQGYTDPADTLSIPAAGDPNNVVYAYGDDLDPSAGGSVRFEETRCTADRSGDGTNDDCFVVEWDSVPPFGGGAAVTVRLALDLDTDEALVEIITDAHTTRPRVVGTENGSGSAGLWFRGDVDGDGTTDADSRAAGPSGSNPVTRFVFGEDAPAVTSTTPADDATGVSLGTNVVINFSEPMNTGSIALTVLTGTDPGGWSPTWSNNDKTVTYIHNDFADSETVGLQITAQDTSGNDVTAQGNGVSGCASNAYCFDFSTVDQTAPSDVSKVTSSSGDSSVTTNWKNPATDFSGVLVVRRAAAEVNASPTDGTTYSPGDSLGAGNDVVCVTSGATTSCTDSAVTNGTTYYYKAFAFDAAHNYAPGVQVVAFPRATTNFKWAYTTTSSVLAPAGTIAGVYVVSAGNDRLIHRMNEADGGRGGWDPPAVGGAVQARPMAGDINPDGTADNVVVLSAQDGVVYRYGLSDGALDGSRDAVTDAGCASGILQGSPAVMLNAFDANANTTDNGIIVGTRCGTNDNKVLLYDTALSAGPLATYDGDAGTGSDTAGLGIINGSPKILYRDSGNNLVYIPVRADGGDNESLVVLEVTSGPAFGSPVWAEVTGLGDVDTTPEVFDFNASGAYRVVFGNTAGTIYYYDATNRVAGAGSSLVQKDTFTPATSDGAVKAVAVSGRTAGVHWIVWTTDNKIHGIKADVGGASLADASYWSASATGASAPLVLRDVAGTNDTRAYVGTSDGTLIELDATDGTVLRTWTLEANKTIGDPTFDFNTGSNQGIVAGSSSGAIHWVKIN